MSLQCVFEGDTDIPVVEKLAADAGLEIANYLDMGGKSQLDKRLNGFAQAAKGGPWFVLRDLDRDAPCAPGLLRKQRVQPAEWMSYRIAVREVEAWLLADSSAMASFLHVSESLIPADPDAEKDPTLTLVNLARRSKRREIKKQLVPAEGSAAQVGPLYEAAIIEFGTLHWDLARACRKSPSLARAPTAMRELAHRWFKHVDKAR